MHDNYKASQEMLFVNQAYIYLSVKIEYNNILEQSRKTKHVKTLQLALLAMLAVHTHVNVHQNIYIIHCQYLILTSQYISHAWEKESNRLVYQLLLWFCYSPVRIS